MKKHSISSQYLKHADHNFEVCSFLNEKFKIKSGGHCNDWIVTTSFYTSRYYLFALAFKQPYEMEIDGELLKFENFSQYVKKIGGSGHEATIDITYNYLGPEMGNHMAHLYNESKGARYKDYDVSQIEAGKCVFLMKSFRSLVYK